MQRHQWAYSMMRARTLQRQTSRRFARLWAFRLLGVLAALVLPGVAFPIEMELIVDADLRADRYVDAPLLGRLRSGSKVQVMRNEAGWSEVRDLQRTGWLRAGSLGGEGAKSAPEANLKTGRAGTNNYAMVSGIRGYPRAGRHALIVGVSDYQRHGQQDLPGVEADILGATQMALAMGIPRNNLKVLRNEQAGVDDIRAELATLQRQLQSGDRVFVYFAGHGARATSKRPESAAQATVTRQADGKCQAAVVAGDGKVLSAAQLSDWLSPVAAIADKLVLMIDAGNAPALIDQATRADSRLFQSASRFSRPEPVSQCENPGSGLASMVAEQLFSLGVSQDSVLAIDAALGNQTSWEDSIGGSFATQSLATCLLGEALDRDDSGAISFEEISACAQSRLDLSLTSRALPRQTLQIAGNKRLVPVTPAAMNRPDSGLTSTSNLVGPATAASNPAITTSGVQAAFNDLLAQRDAAWGLDASVTRSRLRIGIDPLEITIRSARDGWVYLILLGSDQKSFYLLFPNALDGQNRIQADRPVTLPRDTWRIVSRGPAGLNRLLVVVSARPREILDLPSERAGPFLRSLTDQFGRSTLQAWIGAAADAARPACAIAGESRKPVDARSCSDGFGAIALEIVETAP